MKENELKKDMYVINIKHGNVEKVLNICLMKMESGEWVDGVIYEGKDRFTGNKTIFCKRKSDFLNEFVPHMSFGVWFQKLLELTDENMDEEQMFTYSYDELYDHMDFLEDCFNNGMSPYKTLCVFEP